MAACTGAPKQDARQAGSSGPPAPPKRITAAIIGSPLALSQKVNAGGAGSVPGVDVLEELVSAGLSGIDADGRLFPQLAEAVASVENGRWTVAPDGTMETSWTIRESARWHDGAPFTTDDLLFTIRVGQDRQLAVFREIAYESIQDVLALDQGTIVVRWRRPFIQADTLFSRLLGLPLPRHLLEASYEEERGGFTQIPYWTQAFVGMGPFRVKEWTPGAFAVLEGYAHYVLGRPRIGEIEVRFILDPNTVVANALAGAVDLTLGRGIALEMAMDVQRQWEGGRADPGPTHSWLAMFPQLLDPTPAAMLDVRFRRALLHALDRQHMAEALQFGLMPVAHSFLNPRAPEYSLLATAEARYGFDPRRATDLIAEVGYQRGADGLLRDASAQPLSMELRTIDDRGIQEKSLFTIVDAWQRIGITTEGVLIPRQRQPDRPYRATFPALEMVRQGSDLDQPVRAHSAQTPLPENNYSGNNRSRYRSSSLDSLIDRYLVTIPVPDRLEIMKQIVQHMTDQVVWMGIFYDSEPMLISKRVVGAGPARARPGTPAWNAQLWDVN